jgi:hypothetical protein
MTRTPRTRTATAVAVLAFCCASTRAADTYIGVLPAEPPARVAVVVEGNTFLAYACGQTDDFNQSASAWFRGTVSNGRLEATVGGKTLTAAVERGQVRGTLTGDGDREREFTAKPVPRTAVAGLYRATHEVDGDTLVFGWIVDTKHQVAGGCHGKKRKAVALQPKAPLPPPVPNPSPEQKRESQDLIVQQVDEEPEVQVQGEKVTSAVTPPAGKVVRTGQKK